MDTQPGNAYPVRRVARSFREVRRWFVAPISVSEPIVARSGMEIAAWASRVTTPPVSRTASVFRFRKRAISAGWSWKMRTRTLCSSRRKRRRFRSASGIRRTVICVEPSGLARRGRCVYIPRGRRDLCLSGENRSSRCAMWRIRDQPLCGWNPVPDRDPCGDLGDVLRRRDNGRSTLWSGTGRLRCSLGLACEILDDVNLSGECVPSAPDCPVRFVGGGNSRMWIVDPQPARVRVHSSDWRNTALRDAMTQGSARSACQRWDRMNTAQSTPCCLDCMPFPGGSGCARPIRFALQRWVSIQRAIHHCRRRGDSDSLFPVQTGGRDWRALRANQYL